MKKWFRSFLPLFVQILITWCITEYLMEHVWHSTSWVIELLSYLAVYFILEVSRSLVLKDSSNATTTEDGEKIFPYASPEQLPEEVLTELRLMVAVGDKIKAIKKVRELTGAGLKESKDFVEWTVEDTRTKR